ncbi:methyl-accepting chemotaxis protein [Aestuariirhabdus sp. Z084]|uniref:methyl-accepting chemotaxis protein n=1 Tax=Aestuariirhabdus haliotis TaxID=2918751 RepID=UPI0020BE557D|nr:methyl-accepting chemotaxis protein [Aestuariirhabdus haliotis]MCL6415967.1 methyl-accepting chemotaxis protein [Aestuariirhabdus haliotis]
MNWFSRSLLVQVCTGIIAGVLLIILTALWGISQLSGTISEYDHLVDHDLQNSQRALEMNIEFKRQVQEWKNVLLRGSDDAQRDKYWGRFNKEQEKIQTLGKELSARIDIADAKLLVDQFISEHQKMGTAYTQGYNAFVAANYDSTVGDKAVSGIDRAPSKLLDEASEALNLAAMEHSQKLHDTSQTLIITIAVVMLLLSGAATATIIWYINRSVVAPTLSISQHLTHISEGDLSHTNTIERNDELGSLAEASRQLQQALNATVEQLNSTLVGLQESSGQLKQNSDDINHSTHEQHERTDQVATAMNEMSATASEVANHAANAVGGANDADEASQQGMSVMKNALQTIAAMATEINTTAQVIGELETNSIQIGTVLDVIRSIAEQTNLLALNAAIEAARAGEQGRGFAVVADEVRTLAQRTQQSTTEIQGIIEKVQQGAVNAVSAINQGTSKMTECEEIVEEAANKLEDITSAVEAIRDMNTQIATAAEEQSSVSEDITRNITEITSIASENSDKAKQTSETSLRLVSLSDELDQISRRLRH